jgi:programmed cell death protein 5
MERISPEELRRLELLKKTILSKILSREARERLARIRLVKPNFVAQLEIYLIQLYQSGKISQPLSDEQLKKILEIFSRKKEFRIRRL